MRLLKKIVLLIISLPIGYLIIALLTSSISVHSTQVISEHKHVVYLNTNGIHLDIVLPATLMSSSLKKGLKQSGNDQYFAFGWGDENFYINTPTWNDLTFKNAFCAMFLKSTTLMHVTRFEQLKAKWVEVKISEIQLEKLNNYILSSFLIDNNDSKLILNQIGYSSSDEFYKANGSYSCLKTCNSWVNEGFSKSGLKCCLWTPFDFGLLNKY